MLDPAVVPLAQAVIDAGWVDLVIDCPVMLREGSSTTSSSSNGRCARRSASCPTSLRTPFTQESTSRSSARLATNGPTAVKFAKINEQVQAVLYVPTDEVSEVKLRSGVDAVGPLVDAIDDQLVPTVGGQLAWPPPATTQSGAEGST